ncbi:MFS transporter [Alphaproteobacteria bacterium]|nr:MFS transporter [Alphaproteobacteria bacterium]
MANENTPASSGIVSDFLSSYLEPRMARILLLGMISGLPWVLIGSSLSLWLKEEGLSRSAIGWAGLIFSVYAINFLWAPLIDRVRIPVLTDRLGHRKAWIVTLQAIILVCLLLWSTLSPTTSLALVIGAGLVIAICSATQDITIDALRIEQIDRGDSRGMAAGAAVAVVGWWSGYKLGGMLALMMADYLEKAGVADYWQMTFLFLGVLVVLCNVALMFIPETGTAERAKGQRAAQDAMAERMGGKGALVQLFSFVITTVIDPLWSFFRKNGLRIGLMILAFIFLFKIGEAFMGKMSIVFYKEVGFSKSDIAIYSKGLGWITTVAFTLIGGFFALRTGVVKALLVSGIAMAVTNVLFSVLAWIGPNEVMFAIAVIADDLAAAFATVAFVTFISLLVDRNYTATQYALLASIGTLGRTLLASSSGALVDGLDGDWGLFFIITAVMVIPSLLMLWTLRHRLTSWQN